MRMTLTGVGVIGMLLLVSASAAAWKRSRSSAANISVSEEAREALGAIAADLVVVRRPRARYEGERRGPGAAPTFATAPRSAGFPGLCAATIVNIAPDGEDVSPITTQEVYKVVGPTAPLPEGWNDAYGDSLRATCAQAGAVIAERPGDFATPVFFWVRGRDSTDAWLSVRALEIAISAVAAGSASVACNDLASAPEWGDQAGCSRTFADLDLATIRNLSIENCENRVGQVCLEAELMRTAHGPVVSTWKVRVEAPLLRTDGSRPDIGNPARIEMSLGGGVYD